MTDIVQNPPFSSQRATCGSRSAPQNGSPSTTIQGAPKAPSASTFSF
jgi:hypothetical protein